MEILKTVGVRTEDYKTLKDYNSYFSSRSGFRIFYLPDGKFFECDKHDSYIDNREECVKMFEEYIKQNA